MKKFLIIIFKFTLLSCFFLYLISRILDYILLDSNIHYYNVWNKIYNGRIDSEIIIIGNSRAKQHYNSALLHKNTSFKTFNLGLGGTPINVLSARWTAYLNHQERPKILIIDVDYNFLGTANYLYKKWQYLPIYNQPEIKALRKSFDKNYYLDTYIPFYKYKGSKFKFLNDYLKDHQSDNSDYIDGFFKNESSWNSKEWSDFKLRTVNQEKYYDFEKTYTKGFKQLELIINECKQKDITVFLCWSPQYEGVFYYNNDNRQKVDSALKDISKNKNIKYFNFDTDDITKDTLSFYNHSHLNFRGANLFTEKLSDSINFYYNN